MPGFGTAFRCENDFFASIPIEKEDYKTLPIRVAIFWQIADYQSNKKGLTS